MTIVKRAYNEFRQEPFGVIRKSSKTSRLADEINYYKKVHRDINKSIFFPRMIASHTGEENWIMMERYDYKNLGQYLLDRKSTVNWDNIMDELSLILSQFSVFTDTQPGNPDYTREMLINKTEREQQAFVDSRPDLKDMLFSTEKVFFMYSNYMQSTDVLPNLSIQLSGVAPFHEIWPSVKKYIETNMLDYNSTMIHGDFCFSNILYSPTTSIFKFIDPRGSYGSPGIYGDQRYDVAKLYHSLKFGGYESIINDVRLFKMSGKVINIIDIGLVFQHIHNVHNKFVKKFFTSGAFNEIEISIITGCIFIGMCARHYDSPNRQILMYLTGLRYFKHAELLGAFK